MHQNSQRSTAGDPERPARRAKELGHLLRPLDQFSPSARRQAMPTPEQETAQDDSHCLLRFLITLAECALVSESENSNKN